MATDEQRQLEREGIATTDERDRLRADVKVARQVGNLKAIAAARLRLKEATNRSNDIMARYQRSLGVAPPPPPPDTRKIDAARDVVEDLTDLIAKADRAGLAPIAKTERVNDFETPKGIF